MAVVGVESVETGLYAAGDVAVIVEGPRDEAIVAGEACESCCGVFASDALSVLDRPTGRRADGGVAETGYLSRGAEVEAVYC